MLLTFVSLSKKSLTIHALLTFCNCRDMYNTIIGASSVITSLSLFQLKAGPNQIAITSFGLRTLAIIWSSSLHLFISTPSVTFTEMCQ